MDAENVSEPVYGLFVFQNSPIDCFSKCQTVRRATEVGGGRYYFRLRGVRGRAVLEGGVEGWFQVEETGLSE